MKKLFLLFLGAVFVGGCLPQEVERYSASSYVTEDGAIHYEVSVRLESEDEVSEDEDLSNIITYACAAENVTVAHPGEEKRGRGEEPSPEDDFFPRFTCGANPSPCELIPEENAYILACDITAFVAENVPFQMVINWRRENSDDIYTFAISPSFTPEEVGVDVAAEADEDEALAAGNGEDVDFDPNADIKNAVDDDGPDEGGGKDDKGGCSLSISGNHSAPGAGWLVILLLVGFLLQSRWRFSRISAQQN